MSADTPQPPAGSPASLVPASFALNPTGTPFSTTYDDVYHSTAGGLAQCQQVFLAGNGLPQRWQARDRFTIVETGFGLGLNFLTTWAAWAADPQRSAELHFVSLEKHPFAAADLPALHAPFSELADYAAALQAAWPLPLPGCHRLHFAEGRVTLTLVFGDATEWLPKLVCAADAFYLDGFSPAKNPELWSDRIFKGLARLAAPDATLATWSVAGSVRQGLQQAGFQVEKAAGFAHKRQMLRGRLHPQAAAHQRQPWPRLLQPVPATELRGVVLGAGFAGSSVAERLAARGWQVTVVDAIGPGGGASGNHVGVLRPLPSADDNRLARLLRAAFLYTRNHLLQLDAAGLPIRWGATGVLHLARDAAHEASQRRAVERLAAPTDYLQFLDREAASARIGWPVECGGWYFPGGGWGNPPSLCRANLLRHPERIQTVFGQRAERIAQVDGEWQVLAADGSELARAPHLILANAADARRLLREHGASDWLPLRPARGQTTLLPATATPPLELVVCRQGYVTPALDGVRVCGASFIAGDTDDALRPAERDDNLAKLDFILPGFTEQLDAPQREQLTGRVGFRPISPDRLPMLGPVPAVTDNASYPASLDLGARPEAIPRLPGLWLANGFGARGFVWSALAGELLASRMHGDPLPIERDLVAALDPARFLLGDKTRHAAADDGADEG